MTRKPLVFDVQVEEYAVHRVMRQFGLYQEWPLLVTQGAFSCPQSWRRLHSVGTVAHCSIRLYLVIIVQSLTN